MASINGLMAVVEAPKAAANLSVQLIVSCSGFHNRMSQWRNEHWNSWIRVADFLILAALLIAPNRSFALPGLHLPSYCFTCPRDSHGKIKRSAAAKSNFKHLHPCPATGKSSGSCLGYVIDHVVPLKRGGADRPSNMQWQTKEAAKEKDREE